MLTRVEMLNKYNYFISDISYDVDSSDIFSWFNNVSNDIINDGTYPGSDHYFHLLLTKCFDRITYLVSVNTTLAKGSRVNINMNDSIDDVKKIITNIISTNERTDW